MRTRTALIALITLALAACGTGGSPTSSAGPPEPTTTAPTTTTVAPTTTTTIPDGPPVLPRALDQMPEQWVELFHIPYGDTPETLGTSLGGDGDGILWGPEYGAQLPDGTWWFLDTAKFRVAHFSEQGEYLGEIILPESMLVNGIYFQYTMPRALDDGTFLAARFDLSGTNLMVVRNGEISSFSIPFEMSPVTDDGARVYGFEWESGDIVAADPATRAAGIVDWMHTRGGGRFKATREMGVLAVELPDADTSVELEFEAAEIGGPVFLMVEIASDAEGTLHIFMLGLPEIDNSFTLAGYMTITADGVASVVEPIMDPFTPSDPGSPARLGVRPGTTDVWYMNIGVDGVRVYGRR